MSALHIAHDLIHIALLHDAANRTHQLQPICRVTREQVRSRGPRLRLTTADASLRNQLSTRMECLIQWLGFWNGGSCHLIVKGLFANFAWKKGSESTIPEASTIGCAQGYFEQPTMMKASH
jgi:hypothetical protein